MTAFLKIQTLYQAHGKPIKAMRTDGEPCFRDLPSKLLSQLTINLSHSEEYRHCAPVERAIQTIESKFVGAVNGSDMPVPTFL